MLGALGAVRENNHGDISVTVCIEISNYLPSRSIFLIEILFLQDSVHLVLFTTIEDVIIVSYPVPVISMRLQDVVELKK